MPELAEILEKARNLLFIGVGNVLKSDDAAGVMISRQIIERPNIRALTVEVSIENYIGKINSIMPGEIVILDCMHLDLPPGETRILALDEVEDTTFHTHNISLTRLGDFFPYPTFILGIQPQNLAFGDTLSPPVMKTVNRIVRQIFLL
jgi:hydrogenase 3 maturation protease